MVAAKQHPLVSVIIPVYNKEKYVADALDSVLASDYAPFEIIAMDDGSTDESWNILRKYASCDTRVKAFTQPNAGVSAARNHAIEVAQGTYMLIVDADDLIEPTYMSACVEAFAQHPEAKVVTAEADFFGDRTGLWKLPPFSLKKIAHRNIMGCCAMYRKSDWAQTEGYCSEIIAREDWEFWIALLKDGGEVVKLPSLQFHYRREAGTKLVRDRKLKRHVINVLNRRHPEFFERELNGPLRYQRSWSKCINNLYRMLHPRKLFVHPQFSNLKSRIAALPRRFDYNQGTIIYDGRNQLRQFTMLGHEVVVKSFRVPNLVNRIAYGLLRKSKAQRSYEYAELLQREGIGTPQPVGYVTERNGFLFTRSYYACLRSTCPYTFKHLADPAFPHRDAVLRAIGRLAAQMHKRHMIHRDFSQGNILFDVDEQGHVRLEIIDLNRIRFRRVKFSQGCQNFQRLPLDEAGRKVMLTAYAEAMNYDVARCIELANEQAAEEQRRRAKQAAKNS